MVIRIMIFGVCKLNHVHTVKTVLSALTDNNPEATVLVVQSVAVQYLPLTVQCNSSV